MPSEPLIVTFADSRYLPLLAIWLDKLQRLDLRRIRVYGLDAATFEWCRHRNVDVTSLEWQGDLRLLWVQRIAVFRTLLAAGEEFIHSDADAIWLRNPLQEGSARDLREDLVFSQGTTGPRTSMTSGVSYCAAGGSGRDPVRLFRPFSKRSRATYGRSETIRSASTACCSRPAPYGSTPVAAITSYRSRTAPCSAGVRPFAPRCLPPR